MPRRSSRFAGLMLDGRIVSAGGIVRTVKAGVERQFSDDTGINDTATVRTPTGAGETSSLEVTLAWDDASALTSVLAGARDTPRTWCFAPETNRPGSRVLMGQGLHVQSDPIEPEAGDLTRQGLTIVLTGPTTRGRLIAWDAEIAGANGDASRAARRVDLLGPRIPLGGAPPTAGVPPDQEVRRWPGVRENKGGGSGIVAYDIYTLAEHRVGAGDRVLFDSDLAATVDVSAVQDRNRLQVGPATAAVDETPPGPTWLAAAETGPIGDAGWALMTARVNTADGATSLGVIPQHSADGAAWSPIGILAAHTPANWPQAHVFRLAAGRMHRYLNYTWNAAGAGAGFRGRVTCVVSVTGGNR